MIMRWQAYGGAIQTPDDMRGEKARVFGRMPGDWMTATGGAPTDAGIEAWKKVSAPVCNGYKKKSVNRVLKS